MENTSNQNELIPSITDKLVIDWLMQNPDFLNQHPELYEVLTPKPMQTGENVEDFQSHMLNRLQSNQKRLKLHYDELVNISRDNVSAQLQVHKAVIALVKADTLERLLQTITQDLVALFDVDVVRLAIETPLAEHFDPRFNEQNYSGFCAIPPGMVNALMLPHEFSTAVADTHDGFNDMAKLVFDSCAGLIRSYVMIRLELPQSGRAALLAFGVRRPHRFAPNQANELLQFLGEIVGLRLEPCLKREGIDEF